MNHSQPITTANQSQMTTVSSRKGKRWTPEEDTQLLDQLTNNLISFDDIAVSHHRTVGAITMRALMHASKAVQEGMSVEDASIHYRITPDRITQGIVTPPKSPKAADAAPPTLIPVVNAPLKRINKGKKWIPEEDTVLLHELISGVSLNDIALSHQRGVPGIKRRMLALAVAAHNTGMSLEETSRIYRVPTEKITNQITKHAAKQTNKQTVQRPAQQQQVAPNNTSQLEVLLEIRDLLRVLVAHVTKDPTPNTQ